jgi:hypothetical protein
LAYLLQTTNHLLKTHMGLPATPLPPPPAAALAALPPDAAIDAIGPVLESVLANLTAVSSGMRPLTHLLAGKVVILQTNCWEGLAYLLTGSYDAKPGLHRSSA